MKFKTRLLCSTVIITSAFSGTTTVAAQDDEELMLEEIIVTARKRSENIQEAPVAITAFTANSIERANLVSIDEIAKRTAGLSLDSEFGRADDRPVIRGQANILGSSGVSYFVDGVYINGSLLDYDLDQVERIEVVKGPQSALYGRNTYSGAINIITKGPSDEFSGSAKVGFGSNDLFEASVALRGPLSENLSGSFMARKYKADGDFVNQYDGRKVGGIESTSYSGVLFWQVNDKLDVRLRASYLKSDDEHIAIANTDSTENNCFQDTGSFYLGQSRYFCGELLDRPVSFDDVRALNEPGYRRAEKWQTSLTANYELNDSWSMKYIYGFNHTERNDAYDSDYQAESYSTSNFFIAPFFQFFPGGPWAYGHSTVTSASNFTTHSNEISKDYSHEMTLRYAGERTNAVMGLYYLNYDSSSRGTQPFPERFGEAIGESYALQTGRFADYCAAGGIPFLPCGAALEFGFFGPPNFTITTDNGKTNSDLENKAIFASIERHLTDDLKITVEARYAEETINRISWTRDVTYDTAGNIVNVAGGVGSIDDPAAVTFKSFTPRFSAAYKVSDHVNLYAVAAKGTKPGGLNGTLAASNGLATYDEETNWSMELGAKTELFDRQARFNVSLFRNTIKDYQLTESYVASSGQTGTAIRNVGKVRLTGVEAEVTLAPAALPGFMINANIAYTDSEVLQGTDLNQAVLMLTDMTSSGSISTACGRGSAPAALCADPTDVTLQSLLGSIVGHQLPRQAKWQGYASAQYTGEINDEWSWTLSAGISYESKRFVQVHNLAYMGASSLVDANLTIENDSLSIKIWGKNITDDDSVMGAFRFVDVDESYKRSFALSPRQGATYGVNLGWKF
ncbi:TonB-dependent receptor [Temperatibacter marinus]|uniref:TonB-dependent receptor n=1 Tax=Temperatibacter marinus TaxID=1456591 RepID=A0AA52HBC8_9PROT|nr:TonB-dependent receptor [Temperatibacter marinus]WND03503.1 TonB-dependent receptor [Temperatibacter marinus]